MMMGCALLGVFLKRLATWFFGMIVRGVDPKLGSPGCPGPLAGSEVSSCFLAVLAYRYIINEILPKKAYLTAADKYITFACMLCGGIGYGWMCFLW